MRLLQGLVWALLEGVRFEQRLLFWWAKPP
jgi:hypothetical protein